MVNFPLVSLYLVVCLTTVVMAEYGTFCTTQLLEDFLATKLDHTHCRLFIASLRFLTVYCAGSLALNDTFLERADDKVSSLQCQRDLQVVLGRCKVEDDEQMSTTLAAPTTSDVTPSTSSMPGSSMAPTQGENHTSSAVCVWTRALPVIDANGSVNVSYFQKLVDSRHLLTEVLELVCEATKVCGTPGLEHLAELLCGQTQLPPYASISMCNSTATRVTGGEQCSDHSDMTLALTGCLAFLLGVLLTTGTFIFVAKLKHIWCFQAENESVRESTKVTTFETTRNSSVDDGIKMTPVIIDESLVSIRYRRDVASSRTHRRMQKRNFLKASLKSGVSKTRDTNRTSSGRGSDTRRAEGPGASKETDSAKISMQTDITQVSKETDGAEISMETDDTQVFNETDGAKVSRETDGAEISKATYDSQVSKETGDTQVSNETDGAQILNETDGAKVAKETDGVQVSKETNANQTNTMFMTVDNAFELNSGLSSNADNIYSNNRDQRTAE